MHLKKLTAFLLTYNQVKMCSEYINYTIPKNLFRIRNLFSESKKNHFTNLKVQSFNSIKEIDKLLWNSINKNQDIFHSYEFLCSVEESKIEDSKFWYFIVYFKGKPIGSAVLSTFSVLLDLFTNKIIQKIANLIRKKIPNFLKIRVLFCGIPISIGKNTITILNGFFLRNFIYEVVMQMEKIADQYGINFLCFKEYKEDEVKWLDELNEFGFMKLDSLPYVNMQVRWSTFDKYLNSMRHNYRRQIKDSLFNTTAKHPVIREYHSSTDLSSQSETLMLFKPSEFDHQKFFKLYLHVMDRAKTKLEILTEDFFKNVFERLDNKSMILAVVKDNSIIGAAYLVLDSSKITFLLVGLDYNYRDYHNVLMNLLYGIVQIAIDRKCNNIELGQTSYELKQRIGGKCTDEYLFLKSSSLVLNTIIRIFKPLLFPKTIINNRRVFKG